jgi:glycerol uptake facilitator protein
MAVKKAFIGELISECIAVAIIITIGNSAAAMFTLYDPSPYKTAYWGVCITWGLAVTIAIYVTGAVSGTHANPAVTLALAIYRDFPKRKIVPYWVAQVIGAIIGAALVYMMYGPVIDSFNQSQGLTREAGGAAGVFFTHPGDGITPVRAFFNEIVLTGILVLGIFAITDEYNTQAPRADSSALIIGLLVAMIGGAGGYLEAWPINPARDFGPRLFCYFTGWGSAAFPAPLNYWWVPIAGPFCGGVAGATVYQALIRPFLPSRQVPAVPLPDPAWTRPDQPH